jgi:hypothetical protein
VSSNNPQLYGAITKQKETIEMPNDKFVAYIDILGFTDLVSKKKGNNAEIKLTNFYKSIYGIWKDMQYDQEYIKGLGYSDSFTIYTKDDSKESLEMILKFVPKLYKKSLFEHEIMLRGGLAKGKFNLKETVECDNLSKNLFFVQAFIDAYNLENKKEIKGCRFVFDSTIKYILNYNMIQNNYPSKRLENPPNGKLFDLLWIDKTELCQNNNEKLNFFYELAEKNKWSDQYSRTLDLFCLIAGIDKYNLIKQKISEYSGVNRTI